MNPDLLTAVLLLLVAGLGYGLWLWALHSVRTRRPVTNLADYRRTYNRRHLDAVARTGDRRQAS